MVKLGYDPKTNLYYTLFDMTILGHFIPQGTPTDGATGPIFIRPFVPRISWYIKSVILHDHLYREAIRSKDYADEMFKRQLRIDLIELQPNWLGYQARRLQSGLMHLFARLFGRGSY